MLVVRKKKEKKTTIEKSASKEMKTCGQVTIGGGGIDRGKRLATKMPSQHSKKKKKTQKAKLSKEAWPRDNQSTSSSKK